MAKEYWLLFLLFPPNLSEFLILWEICVILEDAKVRGPKSASFTFKPFLLASFSSILFSFRMNMPNMVVYQLNVSLNGITLYWLIFHKRTPFASFPLNSFLLASLSYKLFSFRMNMPNMSVYQLVFLSQ